MHGSIPQGLTMAAMGRAAAVRSSPAVQHPHGFSLALVGKCLVVAPGMDDSP